jgi:hypothetical protein
MKTKIENQNGHDVLIVEIPISKRPSASGKTTVVASTNGNQPSTVVIDGKPVIIGLNAYITKGIDIVEYTEGLLSVAKFHKNS